MSRAKVMVDEFDLLALTVQQQKCFVGDEVQTNAFFYANHVSKPDMALIDVAVYQKIIDGVPRLVLLLSSEEFL